MPDGRIRLGDLRKKGHPGFLQLKRQMSGQLEWGGTSEQGKGGVPGVPWHWRLAPFVTPWWL